MGATGDKKRETTVFAVSRQDLLSNILVDTCLNTFEYNVASSDI